MQDPFPRLSLQFSTKSRVWGDSTPNATGATDPAFVRDGMGKKALLAEKYRCAFCGFVSQANEVHHLNDNHRDSRRENLRVADSLCHAWQHLAELEPGHAYMAYLPGLSPQDANRLQRTIMVALRSDDPALVADAKALLNWLASHRDYAKAAWGSNDPAVFADAIVRLKDDDREKRDAVFEGLAVVFHPAVFSGPTDTWVAEVNVNFPVSTWGYLHRDVMNAPA